MQLPTVIVPVFNACEQLEACLDSIARTVPETTRVILIDDASTDARVRPLLQNWVNSAALDSRLICHQQNRGFVATANHGMRMATTDLVLLNSDTEVTDGWLQRLCACLNSDDSIATATPWSNNGEIVSIPAFCVANPAPENADEIARVIAACGPPSYPHIPTAVGFCMAVSIDAIRRVGLFDEETFGHGYGEENDFCKRAELAGMRNVVCDDAYVVHHGNASFGPLGIKPDAQSMQRLLNKHPDYEREVHKFIQEDPLSLRREQIVGQLRAAGLYG
jgi:GT2 family glycosyltransferase